MKLIILNRGARAARCIDFVAAYSWLGTLSVLAVIGLAGFSGYMLADKNEGGIQSTDIAALQAGLANQQATLHTLNSTAEEEMDALAMRMGELNAHVIRLNALGRRLASMSGLDDGEFDFENPPAVGGPYEISDSYTGNGQLPDLLAEFAILDARLNDQRQQLSALEGLLLNGKLHDRVYPSGRPVNSGWISSYYGKRSDPMSGRSSMHKGIDFAGKYGNDVIAVSDGVVSYSGKRSGYGNLIEIKHGGGYVTGYGHNQENLVAVGDKVSQGQVIALMGSTGRSTGPHVHFEVHRNGKHVNPAKYVQNN